MKLSSHLFRLVLVAMVPLLLFAAALIFMLHRRQVADQEKALVQAAHALSLDIDRALLSSMQTLHALAISEHLDSGDIKRFYDESVRLLRGHDPWDAIVLVDPNGQQLTNTRVPFGTRLPPSSIPEVIAEIRRTGRAGVSNLFSGPVAKSPVVAIGVPVVRDGKIKYVLTSSTSPKFLAEILAEQKTWREHRSVVVDRNKITLARVYDIEKYLGKPAGATLAAKSRESESGFFHGSTLEGLPLASGFHRSQLSGWTVAVALPLATLNAPLNRWLMYVGAGGLALLGLGLLLADFAARRITAPIAALADRAAALGNGAPPPPGHLVKSVAEIDVAARALEDAARTRKQAEDSLREITEFNRQAVEAIPGGAFALDREQRYTMWSGPHAKRTGIPAGEVLGRHVRDIYPDHAAEFVARNQLALAGQTATSPDTQITAAATGETRWSSVTLGPLRNAAGEIVGILGVVTDITQRKRDEAALAAGQLIQATVDSLAAHIAVLDGDGTILAVNRAWRDFAEINKASLNAVGPGANYLRVCAGGQTDNDPVVAACAAGMAAVLRGDKAGFEMEYPCRSAAQKPWFIGRATRFDDNGATRIVVSHEDITARKASEQALLASHQALEQRVEQRTAELARANSLLSANEKRFRAIFDLAAVGVAQIDSATGKLQNVNRKYCEMLGYSAAELLDLDFMRLTYPEDLAPDLAAMEDLKAGKLDEFAMEKRLLHKDGTALWVNLKVSPMWPAGDAPTSHIAVIQDITERKQAEEILSSAEKRFRALIENSADAIALLNREGKLIYLSPSATRLTGRTAEERSGATLNQFHHADDAGRVTAAIAAAIADPRSIQRVEYRTRHQDGSWRWMQAVFTNMLDDPNVGAIVSNYRDITERMEAEQESQRAVAELRELHKVSLAMLQSSDLKSLAQTIVAKALELSGCDLGVIRLRERAPNRIRVIASQGYRDRANLERHELITTLGGNRRTRLRAFSLRQTDIVQRVDRADRMATFKREGIKSLITIPVAVGDNLLGILQLGSRVERDFEPRLIALLETLAHDFGVALQKSQLLDETLAAQEQLRELSRRLVDTQESERRYIAGELHDEIGSLLTALKITVGMGGGSAIAQAQGIIDEALAKARNLAQHLRPPMLEHLGLGPTLEWYAKEFAGRTRIAVEVKLDGMDRRFAGDIEIAVFRIFQEALTNIARHAKARDVVAQLTCTATTLGLTIHDNGVGFDSQAALQQVSSSGLSGMRERVAVLGGRIKISSASDGGTVVEVKIPLPDQGS